MAETGRLITIGVLARASGLTASALRFYDDCGLLVPAEVDPVTGYRYYTQDQRERATAIRLLRAIDVPLDAIADILSGDERRAARLLDQHVDELRRRASEAALVAATIKQTLTAADQVTLPAALLAAAFEQVRAAAAKDREIPVLAGILLQARGNSLSLTATDRYRLSTRTLVPRERRGADWSQVINVREVESIIEWLAPLDEIVATPTDQGLSLTGAGTSGSWRTIDEPFPDHRALLAALAPMRTRLVTARKPLLALLESTSSPVRFEIDRSGLTVLADTSRNRLPAKVTGSDITLFFDRATLLPAVRTAVGPDLMLDLAAPDQPVVLRSATDGDLTTLAMPIHDPASHRQDSR